MRIQTLKIKYPTQLGFLILFICSCLIVGISACKEAPILIKSTPEVTETPIVFDTSYAAKFRPLGINSIPTQKTSLFKGTPKKRKINDYALEVVIANTFPLKNSLARRLSAENKELSPKRMQLTVKKKPVVYNPPNPVLPPFPEVDATMDVQYINELHGLEHSWINCTYQDKKGNIWIGGRFGNLWRYDGKSLEDFTQAKNG